MKKKSLRDIPAWIVFSMLATVAQAELLPGTNLDVQFQSGHVVGAGRTINMLRIPVTDITTGQTTFFDASFRFSFLPNEGFIFEEIASVALSQPVPTSNIRSGVYRDTSNWCFTVDGPSLVDNGRSFYSIRSGGEGCSNNIGFSAHFVTGSAVGHPDIGQRSVAASLNNSWVYGVVSTSVGSGGFGKWRANGLIGVRQNGDQLTFALFDLNNGDTLEPQQSTVLLRTGN